MQKGILVSIFNAYSRLKSSSASHSARIKRMRVRSYPIPWKVFFTMNPISDMMKKYELFEHTADIGIKAYGKNLNEMFKNVAIGMFDIISGAENVKSVGQYKIELATDNIEQLIVDFLSELLYIFDTLHILLGNFEVSISRCNKGYALSANVFGEEFNMKKHRIGKEIKAVTYHMLEVNEKKGYLTVLFDI